MSYMSADEALAYLEESGNGLPWSIVVWDDGSIGLVQGVDVTGKCGCSDTPLEAIEKLAELDAAEDEEDGSQ